ncbi:MAG TPA: CBS domain-containing protein [Actinobacteria bacterium]|nr:CBS domain-containing protein [Actinomycetota bacterium]
MTAADIMQTDVVTIKQDASVQELAELLAEKKISGVPVVDEDNRMVGIVSEGDLVALDADIHFPHYIQFLDSVIFLESMKKFDERLRKAAAAEVGQIMTTEVETVRRETPLTETATLMTDNKINRLPVVEGDVLVGIVTRADLVKAMAGS